MAGMIDYLNLTESSVSKKVLFEACKAQPILRELPIEPTGTTSGGLTAAYNKIGSVQMAGVRGLGENASKANEAKIERVPINLSIITEEMRLDSALKYQVKNGDMDALMVESEVASTAVANKIVYEMINGNKATNGKSFDGLKTIITKAGAIDVEVNGLDISSSATEAIDKAGLKLSQAILGVVGKMGRFRPNILITNASCSAPLVGALKSAGVAQDVTFASWGKDLGTISANGDGLTYTLTEFAGMKIIGVDDEFLPCNSDGTCDVFVIYANDRDGARFLAPKELYKKEGFVDVSLPNLDGNDVLAGGFAQSVCSFVVPSLKQVARIKGIKVTDAVE